MKTALGSLLALLLLVAASADAAPRPITPVRLDETAFIAPFASGPVRTPVRITSFNDLIEKFGPLPRPLPASAFTSGYWELAAYFANGGRAAWVVRSEDELPSAEDLRALEPEIDEIHTITMPALPYFDALETRDILDAAVGFVERHHGLLIVDPIATAKTPEQVRAWNGALPVLLSPNVAVYFPRVQVLTPIGIDWIGPSGAVEGAIAGALNTDGPGISYGNLRLDVLNVEYKLTDAESGPLLTPTQELGAINPIRSFNGLGVMIWGARSQLGEYLRTRFVLDLIDRSVSRGLQQFAFEPNNAQTWSAMRDSAATFLTGLAKDGVITGGATPADTFSVSIGLGSTMTGEDLENGIARMVIEVAVNNPAEFELVTIEVQMQAALGGSPSKPARSRSSTAP